MGDALEALRLAALLPAQIAEVVIAELEAALVHLRSDARRHGEERRELASENMTLLHRARSAEDRLTAILRRMPEAPATGAITRPR